MANSKILEQKQMIIDEIKDRVNSSKSVVLFDYHGVTDADIKDLRTKLREAGADFKVYKKEIKEKKDKETLVKIKRRLSWNNFKIKKIKFILMSKNEKYKNE